LPTEFNFGIERFIKGYYEVVPSNKNNNWYPLLPFIYGSVEL